MHVLDLNGAKISKRQLNQKFRIAKMKHDAILEQLENGNFEKVWEYFENLIEYNYYRVLSANKNIFFNVKH